MAVPGGDGPSLRRRSDRRQEPQLETVSIEIWGFVLRSPTTSITNLLLAAECWVLFRRLQPTGTPRWVPGVRRWRLQEAPGPRDGLRRARSWAGFFFFTAIATLVGAAKHGIPHYPVGLSLSLTIFASGLASGLGVLHAEMATIQAHLKPGPLRGGLRRLALGKLALFAVVLTLSRSFLVVTVNTALGLVPVMVAEYLAFRRGRRDGGWVAGGLAVSSATAFVYLLGISIHSWFNHIDLAHVLMMGSLLMIYRGVRVPGQA